MRDFLLRSETFLCTYRLACMTESELYTAIWPLRKLTHIAQQCLKTLPQIVREIILLVQCLTQHFCWKKVIELYYAGSNLTFGVPFHLVPGLVGRRAVHLERGIALVPYCRLVEVLVIIFKMSLTFGIQSLSHKDLDDDRVSDLTSILKVTNSSTSSCLCYILLLYFCIYYIFLMRV